MAVQLRDLRVGNLHDMEDAMAEARVLIAKEYRD
jgi:hypothetical protein